LLHTVLNYNTTVSNATEICPVIVLYILVKPVLIKTAGIYSNCSTREIIVTWRTRFCSSLGYNKIHNNAVGSMHTSFYSHWYCSADGCRKAGYSKVDIKEIEARSADLDGTMQHIDSNDKRLYSYSVSAIMYNVELDKKSQQQNT